MVTLRVYQAKTYEREEKYIYIRRENVKKMYKEKDVRKG